MGGREGKREGEAEGLERVGRGLKRLLGLRVRPRGLEGLGQRPKGFAVGLGREGKGKE